MDFLDVAAGVILGNLFCGLVLYPILEERKRGRISFTGYLLAAVPAFFLLGILYRMQP